MANPSGWEPQYNGCPLKQPCDSACEVCDHFKVGDKVISIAGNVIGRKGILISNFFHDSKWQVFGVDLGYHNSTKKFAQNYKLLYDPNDIDSYRR